MKKYVSFSLKTIIFLNVSKNNLAGNSSENWFPGQFAETFILIISKDSTTICCIFLTLVEYQNFIDKFPGFPFQNLSN